MPEDYDWGACIRCFMPKSAPDEPDLCAFCEKDIDHLLRKRAETVLAGSSNVPLGGELVSDWRDKHKTRLPRP